MESNHLRTILTEILQATEKEGWSEAPEGRTITLYASHNGSAVSAQKCVAVRQSGELVQARTVRGEIYVMLLADLFTAVVEGGVAEAKRKAGFAPVG